MRYLPILVLALSTAAGAQPLERTPQSLSGQPPATFATVSSELVVVPVTVTDKAGRLVNGIEQARFSIYDNNRLQRIAAFSSEDTPVSIALVIDNSGSMGHKIGEVVAASLAFARASRGDDELIVVGFNETIHDALDGRSISAADRGALESALTSLRPGGQTALYDALMDGMRHLDAAAHARRVVVLVSDGADNASAARLEDVLVKAQQSNVTVYTIGLFDESSADRNPGVLRTLASATGGERYLPTSPGRLLAACDAIAREIRSSYTVGFEPPDRDGRFHRVRVELHETGGQALRVRTRPGYVAAQPQSSR